MVTVLTGMGDAAREEGMLAAPPFQNMQPVASKRWNGATAGA